MVGWHRRSASWHYRYLAGEQLAEETLRGNSMANAEWSLEHVLQTFAYHVSILRTDRTPFGIGLSAGEGSPSAYVQVRIHRRSEDPVWDDMQFKEEGGVWYDVGNRPGAVAEYTRLCTPVIAWAAKNLPKSNASDRKHWPAPAGHR